MPHSSNRLLAPEEQELAGKKANLDALASQLADRELELATLRTDLAQFEKQYLQSVGRRYAILDELRAKIAEARVRHLPDRQATRDHARVTRARAQESARAVGEDATDAPLPDDAPLPPDAHRPESLRKLYRRAAKLLHPDQTLDGSEKERRHHIMAELNDVYARGDEERIREILREWQVSPESVQGDGPGAELVRVSVWSNSGPRTRIHEW